MARWCAVVAVVVAVACRGVQAPQQTASWTNEGQLCIVPEALASGIPTGTLPEEVTFTPGESLAAVVVFSTCETCARQVLASCSVANDGEPIKVEAEAQYSIDDGPCDERCEVVSATCAVRPLAQGNTSFEFGGALLVVESPSTTADYCVGEPTAPVVFPE